MNIKNNNLFLAVILILSSFSIGLLISPLFLNYFIESNYPIYNGTLTPGYQYLVSGEFIGYNVKGGYVVIQSEYEHEIIQVSVSEMRDRIGYKICQHISGDGVKYIILVNGNPSGFGTIKFLLMREIC